jgi:SAM-dependent methyltransferase
VVAEDIYEDFLSIAEAKIKNAGWANVRTVQGTEQNPNLEPARFDVALLVDTYHHLNYPVPMLQHIRHALKPNGRLIIADYYRSRKHPSASDEDLRSHIRADRDEVAAEVEAQGFGLMAQFDHLPNEYVLVFVKTGQ